MKAPSSGPKRIALAAHQFGEHLGDVLRLTRRYRYPAT